MMQTRYHEAIRSIEILSENELSKIDYGAIAPGVTCLTLSYSIVVVHSG